MRPSRAELVLRRIAPAAAWLLMGLACAAWSGAQARDLRPRSIPQTLPEHPGNIFLEGEEVIVPAPPGDAKTWRAVNYDQKVAAKGKVDGRAASETIHVGKLPPGWYKVVRGVGHVTNRVFLAVLPRLKAPTPYSSPICIDVAMAWMFPKEKMGEVANLCQLAGINRVRDRLLWDAMEPKRGEFITSKNQYDLSAQIQHEAGLQILQVSHVSASWANPTPRRFPPDLRDTYNFLQEMARRWKGEVGAFEPWNEADIAMFGGHTGSEMASYQKAAYLGLKAGNPDIIACMNPFAIRRAATLADFKANEATAYYDTYNFHHYEPLEHYPSLYADHRAVSGGKPMWVSECSVHIKWRGDANLKELGDADLCLQSERVTKTFVMAIHEGAKAVFYFMLPHYSEYQLQYGLLRPDLSPRPGYVALAAAGRLLAGARPLGRVRVEDPAIHGYVFDAEPDGHTHKVLVIWGRTNSTFELPALPLQSFDHLGRALNLTNKVLNLSRAPIYAILPPRSLPALIPPPAAPKLASGTPCSLVIQPILTEAQTILDKSACRISSDGTAKVTLAIYNFGKRKAHGHLKITQPKGWKVNLPSGIDLEPGERRELMLGLEAPANTGNLDGSVVIRGSFGRAGKPMLSVHFSSQ